jgi:hypothetical protein
MATIGAFPKLGLAQLEIAAPLELVGAQDADRQVLGIDDPLTPDAAMSLGSARANAAGYVALSGSASLIGELTPAPSTYSVGMAVTIVPGSTNAADATIDLNGLGPRPIVKQGGIPLDSADLAPGIPARIIYDGERFQLMSHTPLPCPTGFTVVTREYCISDQSWDPVTFFSAISACSTLGARLCTISEWMHACSKFEGFLATVITAEWVDHAANNATGAKVLGAGNNGEMDVPGTSCRYGGWSLPENAYRYRCCTDR